MNEVLDKIASSERQTVLSKPKTSPRHNGGLLNTARRRPASGQVFPEHDPPLKISLRR